MTVCRFMEASWLVWQGDVNAGTLLLPWEKVPATWRADEGESRSSVIFPHQVGSLRN
jgi:hypothetical protein